jgi:hypothetical protein
VQDQVLWQRVCQTVEKRQDVSLQPFLEQVPQ